MHAIYNGNEHKSFLKHKGIMLLITLFYWRPQLRGYIVIKKSGSQFSKHDIPIHSGASADHVPFGRQVTLAAPTSSKLSLQT